MAFLIFEQQADRIRATGEGFQLGGHGLIYEAWKKRGKPINKGWHISREELVVLRFSKGGEQSKRLVIDFDPNSKRRIGLIELTDVFAFTCGDDGGVEWTPLMLKVKDLFYKKYEFLSSDDKAKILNAIPISDGKESVEFLYLNGDERSWNWGKNGMTNAAFIQGEARDSDNTSNLKTNSNLSRPSAYSAARWPWPKRRSM